MTDSMLAVAAADKQSVFIAKKIYPFYPGDGYLL